MTFANQANLAANKNFTDTVRAALVTTAADISGEPKPPEMSDQRYGKRQQLARAILDAAGARHLEQFVWLVVTYQGGAIQMNSSDGDVQAAIINVFNDAAGITAND